jgi:glycosyltransferase involved in cell wall biosynthesis
VKLLIVYHAGAGAAARTIYRALTKAGSLDLTVVVPRRVQLDPVYDRSGWLAVDREEHRDGYRVVPIPLVNPSYYSQGFVSAELRRVIRATKPDVIHVLDEPWSGYLFQTLCARAVGSTRAKVLFYGFENVAVRLPLRSRVKWRLAWRLLSGGAAANMAALDNLRRAGFPERRPLERIFWGVPTDVFRPLGDRKDLRAKLNIDCEHVVGFVGRLVPEKGLAVLLAALQRLPRNVHAVIIGSGPTKAELELWAALPSLEGRVHFHDVLDAERIVQYMNAMDVLTLPSLTTRHWKEQYGRVIPEAMACGVPVIGSDSGAIPEVIGAAGMVAPEGDPITLAAAIGDVLTDGTMTKRLVEEGWRRVQEEFSADAMARRLVDFYQRIVRT